MRLTNHLRDNYIKAVMSDVPKIDYQAKAEDMAKAWVESKLKELFPGVDTSAVEDWMNHTSLHMPGRFRSFYTIAPSYEFLKVNADLWQRLEGLEKKLQKQTAQRETLEEKLRGCAYSVSTTKALADLLPEFAHYLPTEATPAKLLPATTGVVDAFSAAGWPKTA